MAQSSGRPTLSLEQKLVADGVASDVVRACCQLFGSYEEAKPYLAGAHTGLPGGGEVKEYWSLKYHRYYYHAGDAANTTWEFPHQLQLSEWLLDASISGLDVGACRKLLSALLWAVQTNAYKGEYLWTALGLLGRLTANIVDCGNTLEKYRTIRKSNPRIREALDTLAGCGEAVLLAAGFVPGRGAEGNDTLIFPGAGADLRPLTLVNAKLQQLIAHKGFTGQAREHDDTGDTPASRHSGTPGFRYQQVIHECSCCSRPINDGTDKLVTRKFDTPPGEFRYECETCSGYNLCETCWDKFMGGTLSPAHPREHPFRTHHPKAAQHNLHSAESANNPWGVQLAGGSAARARERLKDRTGL
ncbi:hypothetical protein CHLRE_08g370350v5 [Chlamydomonas reinhardtii]|uniref:Uncharacterized protein n=1 Tax=Chlamydomonas reinhardtii TaxID=3055 RepID=A0A2K3DH87_CHLRE|nr:uncharacterized protein CHLRE_08g370350v5 [Chlamydomonas reinhardtii]PNW79881.1 hypothetical protein CHLRE_08g370350v5 [Chlamydomonas reinhardtii]